jgi:hypothetical protein
MLNDTRAIFERLVYVIWMALTAVSIGVLTLSPWVTWPDPGVSVVSASLGGLILSRVLHRVGYARLHFQEHGDSLDRVAPRSHSPGSPEHQERASSLRRLLQKWDALEEQRAGGGGDVWEIHAVRREAKSLLQRDPQLRAEFDQEIARRPELGDR